ncbi:Uncharacterised protein [Mycobacteroides abscessus subsp. abscessus]|nr:Uncharacterised protein [Mycobacteroides abscessus subsp. abscessus]
MAPGAGSCQRAMAASLASSAVSIDSTRPSGGRPPADLPKSIDPRVGSNRRPTCRAASISASSRSPASEGNT